jgi:hypothetical protein
MMPLLVKIGAGGGLHSNQAWMAVGKNAEKSGGAALRQWPGSRLL